MYTNVNVLYRAAMNPIMEDKAVTYKRFFTQEEFDRDSGEVLLITGAARDFEDKINLLYCK